jgi:hypothetical protein
MVSFYLYNIFISSVSLIKQLSVLRHDKIIVLGYNKKGRREALGGKFDGV